MNKETVWVVQDSDGAIYGIFKDDNKALERSVKIEQAHDVTGNKAKVFIKTFELED